MRLLNARAALIVALGIIASLVAVLPSKSSVAEPAGQYHQFVPMVVADSAAPPVTADSQAAQLAEDLAAATTDDARSAVLYKVFDTLHIGVYNGDGTPIVSGAETSGQDFYLYTLETDVMAASLGRADRWSFDDLAAFLNKPGALGGGDTVTGQQLQTALANVIHDSQQTPNDAMSFLPLLVRELGLQHSPADDVTAGDTSAATLDALQRQLLLTDLLMSLPHGDAQVTSTSLPEDTNGILRRSGVTAQNVCTDIKGSKAARNLGKFAAGFVEVAGKVISVITAPVDLSHGITLALGVKVEALTDNLKTHYGHEDPGAELQFPVRVRMLDEVTQTQIDCGWMAGIEYPKQGPIPNIKIEWDTMALEKHGTITCGVACQQTDSDGIATLIFNPKQEAKPYGEGRLTSEKGRVEANALYLSSLGNMFGPVNEVVTPKTADFVWEVEYHAKGAWEGTITMNWDQGGQVASGTAHVRFELGLAAPGEGDVHTNVYQLTEGSVQWTQSIPHCQPPSKSGTDILPKGIGALTVTETADTMTYKFTYTGKGIRPTYTIICGDDDVQMPVEMPVTPVLFFLPLADAGGAEYTSQPGALGDVIKGSVIVVGDDGASFRWEWNLKRE